MRPTFERDHAERVGIPQRQLDNASVASAPRCVAFYSGVAALLRPQARDVPGRPWGGPGP
jgi:hypothetical protein